MVRKKIDNRIRVMIENGVTLGHRTLFVVVGHKARDQVPILHHMLSKATIKARPSVLWCYKKELGFSSNRKKRMRHLQKKIKSGVLDVNEDDPFELFVAATNIRYCYYAETHKILGNTFGMCILQDFEAMTPNLLARTVETVEGGGVICLLLHSLNSLKQLYTMSMDVHSRYRTEAHSDIIGRFNERFLLSLASCKRCLVVDDKLNILPISSHCLKLEALPAQTKEEALSDKDRQLIDLKKSFEDTQPVGVLVQRCKTLDQAKALLKFIEAISEKTLRSTVSLTAARGRGKSAALGLAIAAAVAFDYSNIYVTSPSAENLKTLFEFVLKGFDALEYQEHMDYDLIQSTNPEFNKAVIRINIFKDHRQTIQYIHPSDAAKLSQAELVVIDEAAAIPLPLVRQLLGPYLVFMASTINGYEGTGRSLSLKLLQQLRQQSSATATTANGEKSNQNKTSAISSTVRSLRECQLEESIRYAENDDIERWLNDVLCLNCAVLDGPGQGPRMGPTCPPPELCELYYVNRDTLFCYHTAAEKFLKKLMSLYVSSHYKNTPNDLQLMSDAPAHHLFCLLFPIDDTKSAGSVPEILCVVQVCLEGEISKRSIMDGLSRGKRASGDLIPWTVAQQFQDKDFPSLSGARVIRIASHPDYMSMGYGTRALQLLQHYYEGKIPRLAEDDDEEATYAAPNVCKSGTSERRDDSDGEGEREDNEQLLMEEIAPKKDLPPLLLKLSERRPEPLHYLGTCFGLTHDLLRFWKKSGFVPVYLRQTSNELTGEHSCIMLKVLHAGDTDEDTVPGAQKPNTDWLPAFYQDFRKRFINLLGYQFRAFKSQLALSVLDSKNHKVVPKAMTRDQLLVHMSQYDIQRLELYSTNMADYHLIVDLLPTLSRLHFTAHLGDVKLSSVQQALLLSLGLQCKQIEEISSDLDLQTSQLLGLFNRAIKRIVEHLRGILEAAIEESMIQPRDVRMDPARQTLEEDMDDSERVMAKQFKQKHIESLDLSQYAIKGSESEWSTMLTNEDSNKKKMTKQLVTLKRAAEAPKERGEGLSEGKSQSIEKALKKQKRAEGGADGRDRKGSGKKGKGQKQKSKRS